MAVALLGVFEHQFSHFIEVFVTGRTTEFARIFSDVLNAPVADGAVRYIVPRKERKSGVLLLFRGRGLRFGRGLLLLLFLLLETLHL